MLGGRPTIAGLALAACVLTGPTARAQFYSTDPYDPYGRAYRSFAYPGAGYNPSLPNHTMFGEGGIGPDAYSSMSPFNQFEAYINSGPSAPGLRSGRYDQAYRAYDDVFDRTYSSAGAGQYDVDEPYYNNLRERDDLYFKALKEKDPKKRAELMRDLDKLNRKTANSLGASVRREGSYSRVSATSGTESRQPVAGTASRNLAIATPNSRASGRASGTLTDDSEQSFEEKDPLEAFRGRSSYDALERARRLRKSLSAVENDLLPPIGTEAPRESTVRDRGEPSRVGPTRIIRSRAARESLDTSPLAPERPDNSRLVPPEPR
jgi:hypothetical protein